MGQLINRIFGFNRSYIEMARLRLIKNTCLSYVASIKSISRLINRPMTKCILVSMRAIELFRYKTIQIPYWRIYKKQYMYVYLNMYSKLNSGYNDGVQAILEGNPGSNP